MARHTYYIPGYDHYSHRRNKRIVCVLNECERAALDDLMAVLGYSSVSAYIRAQLFRPYNTLTRHQKRQLRDVQSFRSQEPLHPP